MTRHTAYTLAYGSCVAAAALAATLVAGTAHAEGPIVMGESAPFVSTRSRAEVNAEVIRNAAAIRAGATEYALQQQAPAATSGRTRGQATAEFIGARDQVQALQSEDSGSAYLASHAHRVPAATLMAHGDAR